MISYNDAAVMLAKSRSKVSKKLANNTWLELTEENEFAIKLHKTRIVIIHENGTFTLNSGGYRTPTTKDRLNTYLPGSVRISQSLGLWYIGYGWALTTLFYDGIVLDNKGAIITPLIGEDRPSDAAMVAAKKTVDKAVSRYIKGYLQAAIDGSLSGDNLLLEAWEGDSPQEALKALWSVVSQQSYPENLLEVCILGANHGNGPYCVKIAQEGLKRGNSVFLGSDLRKYFMQRKLGLTEIVLNREPTICEAVQAYEPATGYHR
jgi:hypothetical protein